MSGTDVERAISRRIMDHHDRKHREATGFKLLPEQLNLLKTDKRVSIVDQSMSKRL